MNAKSPSAPATRREFLRDGVRYALLAGLAAASASLVSRRGGALPNQTCINRGICRGCNALPNCGLPQALSFKQATQTGSIP
ncbi:MAG: hypothetical protein RMK20_15880 [Verrucomicrobiales bacterium]|nr:hypothetical protein [Verrucomicrobiales bacterium]